MKAFKIILGLLITYAAGKEYISASKQLSTFFDLGISIAVILMLVLSAWLLGSGVAKEKLSIKSWQYVKYFGATFVMFLLFAFISLVTFKFEPDIVTVNGIKVDIAEFMNGSKKIMPDEKQRRDYCVCVVTKLTTNKAIAEKYRSNFETGKLSNVIIELQSGPEAEALNLHECLGSGLDMKWSAEFEQGLRADLMKQLNDLQISGTNDLKRYCDCVVDEYKTIPVKTLTSADFSESKNALRIDSLCELKSRISRE